MHTPVQKFNAHPSSKKFNAHPFQIGCTAKKNKLNALPSKNRKTWMEEWKNWKFRNPEITRQEIFGNINPMQTSERKRTRKQEFRGKTNLNLLKNKEDHVGRVNFSSRLDKLTSLSSGTCHRKWNLSRMIKNLMKPAKKNPRIASASQNVFARFFGHFFACSGLSKINAFGWTRCEI